MSGTNIHIGIAAYHEAGHAMAALRERRIVTGIGVSTVTPGNGLCVHARSRKNPYELHLNSGSAKAAWLHTLSTFRSDIRIALAGPLAEAKALGKPLRSLGARSDLECCIRLARRVNALHDYASGFADIEPINGDDILNLERRKIRSWLAQPTIWRTVRMVAYALTLKGTMNGQDLDRIVGIALTSEGQSYLRFGFSPRMPIGQVNCRRRFGRIPWRKSDAPSIIRRGYPSTNLFRDC